MESERDVKTQELEDMKKILKQKDQILSTYQNRDQTTENTLHFQIEQEQKYQDMVQQYHVLEEELRGMEDYIR